MKKKLMFLVVVTMAAFFCGSFGLATAADQPIKWKMVTTWTPAINLIEGDKNFAKLVNELSNGRLQITVSPAGELVPATAVFDTVSKGAVECGGDWPSYWAGKNSAFDLLGSYPMGLGQYDMINWYYHGGGKQVFDDLFGKYNMMYFITSVTPMESGIRTRVPIKTLAEYKGKKLRMSGKAQGHILQKLGAAQVMISGGEIYQALQMGTLDGAEFCSPSIDWKMGFAEVTKYNIGPGWHQPSSVMGLMINKQAWQKLPADLKIIVERAAMANVAYMSSWYETGNIEALKLFEKSGHKIFKLSTADLKKIEGYSWEYLVEEAKKNPDYQKAALSMFQFLKDFQPTRDFEEPFSQGRRPFTWPKLPGLK
ncbi:MAG: TRAP transporter substrate-binding protein DctP [Syntrophales bacterium]|jgi:TRAP-type mannitol/chloroaromatic compound transport system substrate-binding protein|nr:TRAP transporter substrate-binding protein DctP [Syntrophales bacterium]